VVADPAAELGRRPGAGLDRVRGSQTLLREPLSQLPHHSSVLMPCFLCCCCCCCCCCYSCLLLLAACCAYLAVSSLGKGHTQPLLFPLPSPSARLLTPPPALHTHTRSDSLRSRIDESFDVDDTLEGAKDAYWMGERWVAGGSS
jgi:hypothetical protein